MHDLYWQQDDGLHSLKQDEAGSGGGGGGMGGGGGGGK